MLQRNEPSDRRPDRSKNQRCHQLATPGDGTAPPPNPEIDLDHAEPLLRVDQPGAPAPVIPAQAGIQDGRDRVFETG